MLNRLVLSVFLLFSASLGAMNLRPTCSILFDGSLDDYANKPLPAELTNVETFGDPKNPAIVYIPGLGGSLFGWKQIIDLKKDYYVIMFQPRGHDPVPSVGRSMQSSILAADLKAKLDDMGIEKTFVFGYSMGGRAAARFGAMYPDNTLGVIVDDMHMKDLTNSKTYGGQGLKEVLAELAESYPSYRLAYKGLEKAVEVVRARGVYVNERGLRLISFTKSHYDKRVRLSGGSLWMAHGLHEDLTDALQDIHKNKVPILALHGSVLFGVGLDHIKEHAPHVETKQYYGHGFGSGGDWRVIDNFLGRNKSGRIAEALDSYNEKPLPKELIEHRVYSSDKAENGTVLLIHGLGSNLHTWEKGEFHSDELLVGLRSKYQVVSLSLRGHGYTATVGNNYSLDIMADDAASLLKGLNISKVKVIGHSLGARVALKLTERHPGLVDSVVFEDMHFKSVRRARSLAWMFEQVEILKTFPLSFASRDELLDFAMKSTLHDGMKERLTKGNNIVIGADGRARINAWNIFEAAIGEELGPQLAALKVPALFLAADPEKTDWSGNPTAFLRGPGVEHLLASKPDAKIIVAQGSGHGIHVDNPKLYLKSLDEFWGK